MPGCDQDSLRYLEILTDFYILLNSLFFIAKSSVREGFGYVFFHVKRKISLSL